MRTPSRSTLGLCLGVFIGLLMAGIALEAYSGGAAAACSQRRAQAQAWEASNPGVDLPQGVMPTCDDWTKPRVVTKGMILVSAWGVVALAAVLAFQSKGTRRARRLPSVLVHPAHVSSRRR